MRLLPSLPSPSPPRPPGGLRYDDEKPNKNVLSWNVKVLKLSKTKRYLDKPVCLEFWRLLDQFVGVHNPRYNPEAIAQVG